MEKTKKIRTICNIATLVLGVLAAVACFVFAMGDNNKQGPLNISMALTYVLIGLAIAIILFFMISQIISDKNRMFRFGLLLGIAIIVVVIAYLFAGSELSETASKLEVSSSVFKWSGTLINMAYIMLIGVILSFVGTSLYAKLKK